MAAVVPIVAAAQTEGEITLTYSENMTCDSGQGSAMALPACEMSEDGTVLDLTFVNPQTRSGAFDGHSVLYGWLEGNLAEGTFEAGGTTFFSGEVEGCGSGTVYFDWAASGVLDESGALIWETNTLTSVPGGTLPVTATTVELGANDAVQNDDGSFTMISPVTYSCDAAVLGQSSAPVTVVVPGTDQWTDTGIDLKIDDTVSIEADGEVTPSAGGVPLHGPDGVPDGRGQQYNLEGLEEANHNSLIGRIGEDGAPFQVGSQLLSKADTDGRLFLGVNDVGVANNAGEFTATVTVNP